MVDQNFAFLFILLFLGPYTLNMLYLSVFYHRGFTHSALELKPWLHKFVIHSGSWLTGIDPLAWACLHRMHHEYSDTDLDPHSPAKDGLIAVLPKQIKGYKQALIGLMKKNPEYLRFVPDLKMKVSWVNRSGYWLLPHTLHLVVAVTLSFFLGSWAFGLAYWSGIMSHPIQGWLVNSFGHSKGYRNFDLSDESTNNTLVAWCVFGEGYQNNHHQFPHSAKFSLRWFEIDPGWALVCILKFLGMVENVQVPSLPRKSPRVLSESHETW